MLDRYGWDERVAAQFGAAAVAGSRPGRVLVEHRGQYVIVGVDGTLDGAISGRFRHHASSSEDFPAVGDWVVYTVEADAAGAVVHSVLPRRSQFARPARGEMTGPQVVAANIDLILIVTALDHDFNLRRIERYTTLAWSSGAEPIIVLNKADVCADVPGRVADVATVAPGVPIRVLAARDGIGLETLTPLLEPGRTVALLGSSGVGKSTIVNALLGYERQQTAEVRPDDQRGRHTTTVRELLVTDSGVLLIDSPGMRSVGMWEIEAGLDEAFADVAALAMDCRFSDCTHTSEPACAVNRAIAEGRLPAARLESLRKLGSESAALAARTDAIARAKSKRHWKIIHKSVRNHMRAKYGPEA